MKNIHKKSLAMALIRAGHDLHHCVKNFRNPKYEIFVFVETPELIVDMLAINKQIRLQQQLNMQLNRRMAI
jgi:hypothetical protein